MLVVVRNHLLQLQSPDPTCHSWCHVRALPLPVAEAEEQAGGRAVACMWELLHDFWSCGGPLAVAPQGFALRAAPD